MSIATEISRLQTAKANIKSAIESTGQVSVPSGTTLDGYDSYIEDIYARFIVTNALDGHFVIPDGIPNIRSYAFSNTRITGVTIPDSVINIGIYAFNSCTLLRDITFPSGITSTGNYVCFQCTNLTGATVPSGVKTIGTGAFNGCQNLKKIVIPESVTVIGTTAFNGCRSLKYIRFLGTTPPTLNSATALGGATTYDFPIYVPDSAVDAYKAKNVFTSYAHRIFGVSEMPPENIEGYEILDYIESDGTFYIPTDVIMNNNMWFEYKFNLTTYPGTTQQHIFTGRYYRTAQIVSNGNFYVRRGSINDSHNANTYLVSTTPMFETGKTRIVKAFRSGDSIVVDTTTKGTLATTTYDTADDTPGYFFTAVASSDAATYGAKGILYYLKIGTVGGSITHNFIPVKRNSDNKIGMYDAVNNVFYPSVSVS